ncbi:MAG: CHASE2 domain-containing protein [Candidatus Omnitrophica bacterium]|nr:CHASE2 domain-containing protein [Candidatus Omnitrophota bacterium]
MPINKPLSIIILTLILAGLLFLGLRQFRLDEAIHWKIYENLLKLELVLRPPPEKIKDILLVTIDNPTLNHAKNRWPFPRSEFARVIDNLRNAKAKVIAFDFVFAGKSTPQDDACLKSALQKAKVVMASAIDNDGIVEVFTLPDLTSHIPSGFTTKLQDRDGLIRRNLTYLVNEKHPSSGLLSWEMQILKSAEDIDIHTLKTVNSAVYFQSRRGRRWKIPVDRKTNSFLIHFRGHTKDFNRISFYRILNNDFDAAKVKDKIVLIGPASTLLGDLHSTPIGWLPGLTLNANAFLNLYTQDFIRPLPAAWQYFVLILGLALSGFALSRLGPFRSALFIVAEISAFLLLSYLLITCDYTWNYSLFPVLTLFSALWARRIYKLIGGHLKEQHGH